MSDRGKALRPVKAAAGEHSGKSAPQMPLEAVAVEFYLVDVFVPGRGIIPQRGKLRGDEAGMFRAFGAGD